MIASSDGKHVLCSDDWEHIVLWQPKCSCAVECSGSDCETSGLGAEVPVHIWASVRLRAVWPAVMHFESVFKSHEFSLFIFPSVEQGWLHFQ